jgi:hypothetical protein
MPLKSYGQWLYEQTNAGLPTNVRPPITVEPYAVWFRRMTGRSTDAAPVLENSRPHAVAELTPNAPALGVSRNPFRGLAARFFG